MGSLQDQQLLGKVSQHCRTGFSAAPPHYPVGWWKSRHGATPPPQGPPLQAKCRPAYRRLLAAVNPVCLALEHTGFGSTPGDTANSKLLPKKLLFPSEASLSAPFPSGPCFYSPTSFLFKNVKKHTLPASTSASMLQPLRGCQYTDPELTPMGRVQQSRLLWFPLYPNTLQLHTQLINFAPWSVPSALLLCRQREGMNPEMLCFSFLFHINLQRNTPPPPSHTNSPVPARSLPFLPLILQPAFLFCA